MDTLQKLRDAGLFVRRARDAKSYQIYELQAGRTAEALHEYLKADWENGITREWVTSRVGVFHHGDIWALSRWDYTPGPGPDDFSKTYATEDEVLAAALNYFTGEPTVLDGWLIPFHRHPQLDFNMVQQAIRSATNTSAHEFEDIVKERWLTIGEKWRNNPFQYVFLDIPHTIDSEMRLALRRDSQEAFVVSL